MATDFFNENIVNCKLDDLVNKNIYVLLIHIEDEISLYEAKVFKNISASLVNVQVNIKFLLRHIKPYLVNDLGQGDFDKLYEKVSVKNPKLNDFEAVLDKINQWFFNKKTRVIL